MKKLTTKQVKKLSQTHPVQYDCKECGHTTHMTPEAAAEPCMREPQELQLCASCHSRHVVFTMRTIMGILNTPSGKRKRGAWADRDVGSKLNG